MKLTFLLVLWCSIAITNCALDFDKALELSAPHTEIPFKSAIYSWLNTIKGFLPDKRVQLSSEYGKIDDGRLLNELKNQFMYFCSMYGFTQASFTIAYAEYDVILEMCENVVTAITTGINIANPVTQRQEDFNEKFNKSSTDIFNRMQQLKIKFSEHFTRLGDLDAAYLSMGMETLFGELNMPKMYFEDAIDLAAAIWDRADDLRGFFQQERFDKYDVRSIIRIMPVARVLSFIKKSEFSTIEVSPHNMDIVAANCASIMKKQNAIFKLRSELDGSRQFENSIRQIGELAQQIKALMVQIIYQLFVCHPQIVKNFDEIMLQLNNECEQWRSKISSNSSGEVVEFKRTIVAIAESVGKINTHLQELSGNQRKDDIQDYYIPTNYPFLVGATHYLLKAYLDERISELPVSEEVFTEIKTYAALMSTNQTSLDKTIGELRALKRGKKARRILMESLKEIQENIVNAFYNICDCLSASMPDASSQENDEYLDIRSQYIDAIKELKQFREDVKWYTDKKRKLDSISQDTASGDSGNSFASSLHTFSINSTSNV